MRLRLFDFHPRAFTLLEALITTALMGIVLSVFALVIQSLSKHGSSIDRKDEVVSAGFTASERLARDIKMAVAWTTPVVADTALVTVLEFDLPDYPNDITRLPPYGPGTSAFPAWNPAAALLRIRYRVFQGELLREVLVGGVFEPTPLAFKVLGFSGQRTDKAEITVNLTIDQAPGPVQSLVQAISLPLFQCWRQP